jgi:hypothetical protein
MALDTLDRIVGEERDGGWGLPGRTVVADFGYGDSGEFRLGLPERGLRYVIAAKGATSGAYPSNTVPVAPRYTGQDRPPTPRLPRRPDLASLAVAARRRALHRVAWAHPTAAMCSRSPAFRVRPANRTIPRASDGSLPDCWLIAESPPANRTQRQLAVQTACRHTTSRPGPPGKDPKRRADYLVCAEYEDLPTPHHDYRAGPVTSRAVQAGAGWQATNWSLYPFGPPSPRPGVPFPWSTL